MFTGIIEATAKVLKKPDSRLVLERPAIFDDLKIGCSIAVSGVCLSVIAFDRASMSFDVIETTLKKTKFGFLKTGDSVNLERAMKADGRFEGHIVMGHCEGVGEVKRAMEQRLIISFPPRLLPTIVPEGSVTLDGVAVTVAGPEKNQLTVALIPHTLKLTTLGSLKKGDRVNIETDILAKYLLKSHAD